LTIAPSPTHIGTHTFTLVARQGNLFVKQDVTVNVVPDPITDGDKIISMPLDPNNATYQYGGLGNATQVVAYESFNSTHYGFSVGDMAVGAVNSTSSTDVVAINQISNLTRLR
jgi:hypothetical protein